VIGSAVSGLACPACVTGQTDGGASGPIFVALLILLPLAAATVAGLVIGRLLRRRSA